MHFCSKVPVPIRIKKIKVKAILICIFPQYRYFQPVLGIRTRFQGNSIILPDPDPQYFLRIQIQIITESSSLPPPLPSSLTLNILSLLTHPTSSSSYTSPPSSLTSTPSSFTTHPSHLTPTTLTPRACRICGPSSGAISQSKIRVFVLQSKTSHFTKNHVGFV